jgi:lipopolysaccharide transport system permease protein
MSHVTELYGQWLRRDLSQRFAGSALGPLWLLLQPLSFIVVITLVFHGFFRTKWPGGDGSALDYGLKVFVGLAVHTFAAEVLARGPGCILAHPYLVTKVRFPLPMIPLVTIGVALAQLLLALLLVMAVVLALGLVEPLQALQVWWAIPLALLPSVALMLGMAWMLAAAGLYLRDLGNLTPAISSFLMFLMPVFYPAEFVPSGLAWFIEFNPLALCIEWLRQILFLGTLPPLQAWWAHSAAAVAVAAAGWWFFQRVRPGFADVL